MSEEGVEIRAGLPVIAFASEAEWEAWLDQNHDSAEGLWMKIGKKGSPAPSVSRKTAVVVALCYGWIDSQSASCDEHSWLQRFTPRRARSKWSRINRDTAEELIESGRMRPAGLAEVERAREDGRWDRAYEPPRTIEVPPDLQERLDASPSAREFFSTLNSRNRYAILHRIHDAKKPETRTRRIDKFVAMLEKGETLY